MKNIPLILIILSLFNSSNLLAGEGASGGDKDETLELVRGQLQLIAMIDRELQLVDDKEAQSEVEKILAQAIDALIGNLPERWTVGEDLLEIELSLKAWELLLSGKYEARHESIVELLLSLKGSSHLDKLKSYIVRTFNEQEFEDLLKRRADAFDIQSVNEMKQKIKKK